MNMSIEHHNIEIGENIELQNQLLQVQKSINELSEQLSELDRVIAQKVEERDKTRKVLEHYRGVEGYLLERLGRVPPPRVQASDSQGFAHLSIREAAYRLLKERQPLSSKEITEELIRRGKAFNRPDPINSVSSVLRYYKDQLFKAERRGKEIFWSLAKEHYVAYEKEKEPQTTGGTRTATPVFTSSDRGSRIFEILKQGGTWDTQKILNELVKYDEGLLYLMNKNTREALHAISAAIRYFNQRNGNPIQVIRRGKRNFYSLAHKQITERTDQAREDQSG